jgi:hypothetical protein
MISPSLRGLQSLLLVFGPSFALADNFVGLFAEKFQTRNPPGRTSGFAVLTEFGSAAPCA